MRLRYRLAINVIDLLIIALALIYVYSQVTAENYIGAPMIIVVSDVDAGLILLAVFLVYLGTVLFVETCLMYMRQDTWLAKAVKGMVSTLLIVLLYPKALAFTLMLFNQSVSADVETVLTTTMVIRTLIRVALGRRWRDI